MFKQVNTMTAKVVTLIVECVFKSLYKAS